MYRIASIRMQSSIETNGKSMHIFDSRALRRILAFRLGCLLVTRTDAAFFSPLTARQYHILPSNLDQSKNNHRRIYHSKQTSASLRHFATADPSSSSSSTTNHYYSGRDNNNNNNKDRNGDHVDNQMGDDYFLQSLGRQELARHFDFVLDDWQLHAGGCICQGYNVIVCAPTGGKYEYCRNAATASVMD